VDHQQQDSQPVPAQQQPSSHGQQPAGNL